MRMSGGCLCGEVRFECEAEPQFQIRCYCTDCRKLGGAAHAGWIGPVAASALSTTREPRWFVSTADSGNEVARAFCPRCGVGVFGRNAMMSGMVFLRASALDDPEAFAPQMSVYASRAPSWDPPAGHLPAFPEMPPMN